MQEPGQSPPKKPAKRAKLFLALAFGLLALAMLWWGLQTPQFPVDLPAGGTTPQQDQTWAEQEQFFTALSKTLRANLGYLVITGVMEREGKIAQFRQLYTQLDQAQLFQELYSQAEQKGLELLLSRKQGEEYLYQAVFLKENQPWVRVFIGVDQEPPATTEPALTAPSSPEPKGRMVLIVDDLGQNLKFFKKLVKLHRNLTFSILPNLTYSKKTALAAEQIGSEVLLHLPMQPLDWPQINPGPGALLLEQSPEELQTQLRADLAQVPQAIGVNNHMGSALIQDEAAMEVVMRQLAQEKLFFLDSKTAPGQVAKNAAALAGVLFFSRDLFLDDNPRQQAIQQQWNKALKIAKERGLVVVICHPKEETYNLLATELPNLDQEGIELVRISYLLAGKP